jgi:hypothetical protein
MTPASGPQEAIDIHIGPHRGRSTWRVLRVSYDTQQPEQRARVAEAIRCLVNPVTPCPSAQTAKSAEVAR